MNEESKQTDKIHAKVSFGGGGMIAITGIIGGVALALGFPLIVLAYGQALGPKMLTVFVLAGLITGGLVALTSAFFGLVIPQHVDGGAPGNGINDWIRWGMERKNWTEQDWKDWADKYKKTE